MEFINPKMFSMLTKNILLKNTSSKRFIFMDLLQYWLFLKSCIHPPYKAPDLTKGTLETLPILYFLSIPNFLFFTFSQLVDATSEAMWTTTTKLFSICVSTLRMYSSILHIWCLIGNKSTIDVWAIRLYPPVDSRGAKARRHVSFSP